MKRIGHAIRLAIGAVTPGLTVLNRLLSMMEWVTTNQALHRNGTKQENKETDETKESVNTIQRCLSFVVGMLEV